jgi:DNA repair protein RadA/Sms
VSKTLTAYTCSSCGHQSPKWMGRCTECGEWNTLVEEVAERKGPAARRRATPPPVRVLSEVPLADSARIGTGIGELDRVLGGGLVPGSLVLIGGEPGVGKSSLLLQALSNLARAGRRTLLVSGEESPAQVRLRAERLGAEAGLRILAETELDAVAAAIEAERPDVCVVDSVQTLFSAELSSPAGSVAQVRAAADRMLRLAKRLDVTVVLVGHVTKEGAVAGPRVLEHLVDATLQFEGDRYGWLRVLRAAKNRFGSTNEIGVFEMTDAGLAGVEDPSAALATGGDGAAGSVLVPVIEGTRPLLLEVQALVAPSELAMPRRMATGVDRNRLSMLVAVLGRHAGVALGASDVFVNMAGGVRVDEPAADLAIALAVVSAHRGVAVSPGLACFGEIGLTGRVRAVAHAPRRLGEAAKLGVTRAVLPAGTAAVGGVRAHEVATVRDAIEAAFA